MNSGSASAPYCNPKLFSLGFFFLSPAFDLKKINELNIFLGFYLIFKTEILPTFSYFCIVLDVNSLQTILSFLYASKL